MIALALALALVTGQPATPAGQVRTDPFQRCAVEALAGRWGTLAPWQADSYQSGLARGLTADRRAKVTCYGPFESPAMSGGPFAWLGNERIRLNDAHCASNPEIPKGSIIWTDWGLRFVVDRGGWVKIGGRFTRAGETANFDCWHRSDLGTRRQAPYVIVRRGW